MIPLHGFSPLFRLSRRELLRALLGLATYLPTSFLLAAAGEPTTRKFSLSALGPFLDTLLPEDESPSATQLGVHRWLDQQAMALGAGDFASLQPEQREAIAGRAEQSAPRTLPSAFFRGVRAVAFESYYAHPESWPSLGFAGPPQPRGFMDYAGPPGRVTK
jgi:hypothetical protein